MNLRRLYKLCFFLTPFVFLFILIMDVNAADAFVDQGASSTATYYSGGGYNCDYACWNPAPFAFRVTLVDSNGKKIAGTTSVDVARGSKISPLRKIEIDNGATPINSNFQYKFSAKDFTNSTAESGVVLLTNPNDYDVTPPEKYVFLEIPDDIFPQYNNNLDTFINDRILSLNNNIESELYKNSFIYAQIWLGPEEASKDDKVKVDFVSLILHYTGYLDKSEPLYTTNRDKETQLRGYYLLFEPVFWFKYKSGSEFIYRYGTVTEIAEKMMVCSSEYCSDKTYQNLTNGFWADYTIKELACGNYTWESPIFGDNKITKGDCWTKYENLGFASRTYNNARHITSLKYGFGVRAISMNFDNEPVSDTFTINSCNLNDSGSLQIYRSGVVNQSIKDVDIFKIQGDDSTSSVYCYDEVTYNFSSVIKKLTSQKQFTYSSLSFANSPYADVKRTCEPGHYSNYKSDIERDYSTSNVALRLYYGDGAAQYNQYEFESTIGEIQMRSDMSTGQVQYKFKVEYKLKNEPIIISNTFIPGVRKGSIVFSNIESMFGASNRYISATKSGDYRDASSGNTYGLIYESGDNCDFTYEVEEGEPIKDFKFREIALDNPFPARDGTSRLPGMNWLNSTNYVFDYITNNRGVIFKTGDSNVSPEAMYDVTEPMYTVTLTPAVMKSIRDYNKKYSYYSMYDASSYHKYKDGADAPSQKIKNKDMEADKLVCNENGRECYSTFLRNNIPSENLSGVCVIDSVSGEELRNKLNTVKVSIPDSNLIMSDMLKIADND